MTEDDRRELSEDDRHVLARNLLKVTDVSTQTSGWVDRIGGVAPEAGVLRENVDWSGSPACVARGVVRYASNGGWGEALKEVVLGRLRRMCG